MKRAVRLPAPAARAARGTGARKTIFELPPLELECMKALWAQGEASVRQIRESLAAADRPLAYTTVETIMDRLARKGAVARRKVGKAHRYTPVYQETAARAQAVAAVVEHFFDGSRQALRAHLAGQPAPERALRPPLRVAVSPAASPAKPAPRARKPASAIPTFDTSLL